MQKQGRQLQNAMITMNHRLSCPAPQLWFGPGTRAVDLMVIEGLELCSVGTSLGDTEDLRHDRLFSALITFPHISRQAVATKWTGEEQQFCICP